MPQLSAVVIAGEPCLSGREIGHETAMISALGHPLIDYVLAALRGCRDVSEVVVSVTGSTPMTEAHVQSRGYQSVRAPGIGHDSDLQYVIRLLSTAYVMAVPANLPLLRPEAIDGIVDAFYQSKKPSMVVGVPVSDVEAAIIEPSSVKDMNGVQAIPCGVAIMDRITALSHSSAEPAYLVTDLEDFAVDVSTVGQLRVAEAILRARRGHDRKTINDS